MRTRRFSRLLSMRKARQSYKQRELRSRRHLLLQPLEERLALTYAIWENGEAAEEEGILWVKLNAYSDIPNGGTDDLLVVNYETIAPEEWYPPDQSHFADEGVDYEYVSGTVYLLPGETALIGIPLKPDTLNKPGEEPSDKPIEEPDEVFAVRDTGWSGGYVLPGEAIATIKAKYVPHDEPKICMCDCGCPVNGTSVNLQTGGLFLNNRGSGLRYDSLANGSPVMSFSTPLRPLNGSSALSYIEVSTSFNGQTPTSVYYSASGVQSSVDYQFAMQGDASALPTGRYRWQATITEHYADSSTRTQYRGGLTNVINREASLFGPGWTPEWLDTLVIQSDGVLLVHGDGNSDWFQELGDGSFRRSAGEFGGNEVVKNTNGSYTITSKTGEVSQFDDDGLLVSRTDRQGNTTTFSYIDADSDSEVDDIEEMVDSMGRTTTITYTSGLASSITTFDGQVIDLTHDGSGRLIEIEEPDPDGVGALARRATDFTYDSTSARIASMTMPSGQTTGYSYDFAGRVETKINPDLTTQEFEAFQTRGLLDTGSGEGTMLNKASLLLKSAVRGTQTNELGETVEFTMDRYGFVLSETNDLGQTTLYERDLEGLLTKVTLPDPDGGGSLTSLVTEYFYDARNNLIEIEYPDGSSEEWEYDTTFNQPISHTDVLQNVTLSTLTAAGNVQTMRRVVGQVDDGINLETDDVVTSYTYTATPTGQNDPPAGLLASETDALGRVTEYDYNARGLVTKITYAVGTADEADVEFEYDAADNLEAFVDELGRRTEYAYDDLNQLKSVTLPDPDGGGPLTSPVTQYVRNAMGKVTKIVDPLGRETTYTYGAFGNVATVTLPDPDGGGPLAAPVTTYDYDDAGKLLSVTDALGRVTSYAYDDAGRNTSITLPDPDGAGPLTSPVTQFSFDAMGRLAGVTDPLNNVTAIEFSTNGLTQNIIGADPDGGGSQTSPETEMEYDAAGNLVSSTDALSRVTTYAYDELNRLTSVTQPDPDGGGPLASPTTHYEYDKAGNLWFVTDATGKVTQYIYDARNRLIEQLLPDPDAGGPLTSPTIEYAYDDAGQLVSVTDAMGQVTSYTFDALGRVTAVTMPDPDGGGSLASPVYSTTYDAVGNMLTETDPLGNVTSYDYDNLDRLIELTQPDPDGVGSLTAPVTTFTYDAVGNRLTLTDPVGNTTTWTYDALNRLLTDTNELSGVRSYEYDAVGNLLEMTDRNGRVRTFEYDNLYRRTAEKWLDGVNVVRTLSYSFDAAGQLTSASDPAAEYTYTYDALGRATEIEHDLAALGYTVVMTQAFDVMFRRTSLAATIDSVDDFINAYQYDALSRMTRITQQGQTGGNAVAEKRIDLAYNAAGQFTTIDRFADAAGTLLVVGTDYTYDLIGRLTDLVHAQDTTTLASYEWTYDAFNRITQFVSLDGTSNYSYDATSQLTDADHDYQTDEDYAYDENGNRTMTGYSTGDNNRLTSDGTFNYTYDNEGNRLTRTRIASGAADDYLTEYTWDYRNRLTKIVFKNNGGTPTKVVQYEYDIFDRRIAKEVDDNGNGVFDRSEQYVYDGEHIALRFVDADGDGSQASSLANRYLHGSVIDQILADEQVDSLLSEGDILWPLTDNLGTVRDLATYDAVLAETTVENHLTYDSFGQIISETDPNIDHQFAYTGREWDADAGMYYYRARWYDPAVGRFISEDPTGFVASDPNLQRYVANCPLIYTDPSGLIRRVPTGQPRTAPEGQFATQWRFELDNTYDFDVLLIQRIRVKMIRFYQCGTNRNFFDIGEIEYFEIVGRVPAGERVATGNPIDTWSSHGPIRGPQGERLRGTIWMEGQIRAIQVTDEVERGIIGWRPGRIFSNAERFRWTSGSFPSNESIQGWWDSELAEIERGANSPAVTRLIVTWVCSDRNATITPREITPSKTNPWHPK